MQKHRTLSNVHPGVLAIWSGLLLVGIAQPAARGQPSITGLGFLPHAPEGTPSSFATCVSADGQVVAGFSVADYVTGSPPEAFRWTRAGGLQSLGLANGGGTQTYGINGNGSVIVGMGDFDSNPAYLDSGFRWVADAGGGPGTMTAITGTGTSVVGVSGDGLSAIGFGGPGGFVWTPQSGFNVLPLAAPGADMAPWAISRDGSTIVGAFSVGNVIQAFRWTSGGGSVPLGFLPGLTRSDSRVVNRDGSVAFGRCDGPAGQKQLFRWTAVEGMTPIGPLSTDPSGPTALAVSGDGSVLGGFFPPGFGHFGAFIWRRDLGIVILGDYLAHMGVSETDHWTLWDVQGISDDGTVLVGSAFDRNTNSTRQAYVVVLPPPPAPPCGSADFNSDGDFGTDADIEAFFRVLAGGACAFCGNADFNGDGDAGTDVDIEAFFRVLAGQGC